MPVDILIGLLMAGTAFGQLALVADDLRAGKLPSLQSLQKAKLSQSRRLHAQKFDPEVPYEPHHHDYPCFLSRIYSPSSSTSSILTKTSSRTSTSTCSSTSSTRSPPPSILKRKDPSHRQVPRVSFKHNAGRRKSDPSVAVDGLNVGRERASPTRRVTFEEGLP